LSSRIFYKFCGSDTLTFIHKPYFLSVIGPGAAAR